MLKVHTYCRKEDATDLARIKRTRWQPWVFIVAGEWSQSPVNDGNVWFAAAASADRRRWALMSRGFPTRIAAVAEVDHDLAVEDAAGAMLRRLREDGGEYFDGVHHQNDDLDLDRLTAVYRGKAEVSDRKVTSDYNDPSLLHAATGSGDDLDVAERC